MKKVFYDGLKNDVWTTRKARINMSERFIVKDQMWKLVNFVYSIYIIGLSILGINEKIGTQNYNLLILFLSITIGMISLYSNSKNYNERALSLKYHYINLKKIYNDLEVLDPQNHFEKIKELELIYLEELKVTENHTAFDNYKAIKNDSWQLEKFKKIKWYKKLWYDYIVSFEDYLKTVFFLGAPWVSFIVLKVGILKIS